MENIYKLRRLQFYKPCAISGGIGMLPDIGRQSARTIAILSKMSIFKTEKELTKFRYNYI